jgi:RimJ/RimL family protein N-acetyltransferase
VEYFAGVKRAASPDTISSTLFQRAWSFSNSGVLVRPLSLDHAHGLLPGALDPDLWRYSRTRPETEEDLLMYIDDAIAERRAGLSYAFALLDPRSGRPAGCTRLYNFSWPDARLEIGHTWVLKDFHRTGLNRAAKFALLSFAFEVCGIARVEFQADSRNEVSRRALKGIGAVEEGIHRSNRINWDGYRRDTVWFSILASEWPGLCQTVFSPWHEAGTPG